MGRFLNSKMSYGDYCETASEPFFPISQNRSKNGFPQPEKRIRIFALQGRGDLGKVLWRIGHAILTEYDVL